MNQPTSHTLTLLDFNGAPFGVIRLSPNPDAPNKGECIFDVRLSEPDQAGRDEVRWLRKRGYQSKGEHKFKLGDDGTLTVSQGEFRVSFSVADDGSMRSEPPAPRVGVAWS